MTLNKLFAASVLVGTSVFAAQSAMAYGQGDVFVRGGVVKSETTGTGNYKDDTNWFGAVGVMPTDNLGIEVNTTQKSTFDGSGTSGKFESRPVSLMAQYYPLGGTDSKVQPYVGGGATYMTFTNSSAEDGTKSLKSRQWAPSAQLGVDLQVTDNWGVSGFAQYTDISAEYNEGGKQKLDPLAVGAGVSFRF
ncbi:outer membrane protein W [Kushneria pakistanensis]|uniref:Outer membrane protein W n=1 Tax=Kushneria pakistanensis TaxID=1508770 RepID=A0ABQ3FMY0_9GAMM|nr:OmpW family outer membrane protein [Kushneria pakistanensis]GHC30804.1 outer membrane protein W [Kushneria pakistanensis]